MIKINLHIEADTVGEYQQVLFALQGGKMLQSISMSEEDIDTLCEQEYELNKETDATGATKPERKRRTKAEIEAEKAASATGVATVPPVDTTPATQPKAPITAPAADPATLTLDDLRKMVFPINSHSEEAKMAVKDAIMELGADSFSKIPEAKFSEAKQLFHNLGVRFGIHPPF